MIAAFTSVFKKERFNPVYRYIYPAAMENNMALAVIGDKQTGTAVATVVCLNTIPQVTGAQLADKTHSINLTNSSGKKKGSCVINSTTNELHLATGSTDVSTWVNQGAVAAIITPA